MESDFQEISEGPTIEQLAQCTKAQLMSIAEQYHLEIAQTSLKKGQLRAKVVTALIEQGVLPRESSQPDEEQGLHVSAGLTVGKTEQVILKSHDAQSVRLRELELQFRIKELEMEAKEREEVRRFEMEVETST